MVNFHGELRPNPPSPVPVTPTQSSEQTKSKLITESIQYRIPQLQRSKKSLLIKTSLKKVNNKPFDANELSILSALSKFYIAKSKGEYPILSVREQAELVLILKKSINNLAINKQMVELLKNEKTIQRLNISKEIVELFKNLSYRTIGLENADTISIKTEDLINKYMKKEDVQNSDKLSLKEMGFLDSFPKIELNFLSEFLDLDNVDIIIKYLFETHRKFYLLKGQIELILETQSNYKPGDLIFVDGSKKHRFKNTESSVAERIQSRVLGTDISHVAVCYKKQIQNNVDGDQLSHMMEVYQQSDFTMSDKLTMSAYRLDPNTLIPKPILHKIREMFLAQNKDPYREILKLYQTIHNEIHSSQTHAFKELINPQSRRLLAGITQITGTHIDSSKSSDFLRMHQQILQKGQLQQKKMICSEFAATTTIAALYELELRLRTQLNQFLTEQNLHPEGKPIIIIPFSPGEKIDQITPQRLVKLLADKQQLVRIDPHPLLSYLVKSEDLKINPSEEKLPVSSIDGFQVEQLPDLSLVPLPEPLPTPVSVVPLKTKWAVNIAGRFNIQMQQDEKRSSNPYQSLYNVRKEIYAQKEIWRIKLQQMDHHTGLRSEFMQMRREGHLVPVSSGQGGAYIFKVNDRPIFIIKPSDEDILCLNNRKACASPYGQEEKRMRVRKNIPLYTSVQKEALACQIAQCCGMQHFMPKVDIAIFEDANFHDIFDHTEEMEKAPETFLKQAGRPDREKLCSVQEFLPDHQDLSDFLDMIEKSGKTLHRTDEQIEEELYQLFDHEEIENLALWMCLSGETDGHPGNFMVYKKSDNPVKYGLKKIDNALSFPESAAQSEFHSCLSAVFALHMQKKLSDSAKSLIHSINKDAIKELMKQYDAENSVPSFEKRLELIINLSKIEGITLKELEKSIQCGKNSRELKKQAKAAEELTSIEEFAQSTLVISTMQQDDSKSKDKKPSYME